MSIFTQHRSAAPQLIVDSLRTAARAADAAMQRLERGGIDTTVTSSAADAAAASRQALDALDTLGRSSSLDAAVRRYATHAVRDASRAVELLASARDGSATGHASADEDATSLALEHLSKVEISARLGADFGERSLEQPGGGSAADSVNETEGSTWGRTTGDVDPSSLDPNGNVPRGSDGTWVGHDGSVYTEDGSAYGSDTTTGPDGESYSGI